jgi:type II secretory pathway component PulC
MASVPIQMVTIREYWDALSLRERRMVALLAVAILLFVLYLLTRGDGAEEPVELVQAPPPVVAAPAPVAYTPPAPPVAVVPAPAPAQVGSLLLVGVFGGGPGGGAAILQGADGSQRLVRVGRDVQPGLSLRSVGLNHVVVGGPGGDLRLEIGKAVGTPVAAPAAPTADAPAPVPAGAPSSEAVRRETLQYQLGTEPVTVAGVQGYRIKPGARLPHLEKAGLRPGDVIIGMNGGTGFDDERLMEMSYEINNAGGAEFEVMRDGRRLKLAVRK